MNTTVCNALLATNYSSVSLTGNGTYLRIPSCIGSSPYNSVLTSFSATQMRSESLTFLSSGLTSLSLDACRFGLDASSLSSSPGASSPSLASPSLQPAAVAASTIGFFSNGSIDWSYLTSTASGLKSISITNSGLRGNVPSLPLSTITLSGNLLSGSLPLDLFSLTPNAGLSTCSVDLSNNRISGSIPDALFVPLNYSIRPLIMGLVVTLSNNLITGTLPPSLLATIDYKATFSLSFRNNSISGTLPAGFIPALVHSAISQPVWSFDFANNKLSGTIPSGFSLLSIAYKYTLDLSYNQLEGPLPENGFFNSSFPLNLEGSYPPVPPVFTLILSHNNISGSIPPNLFQYLSSQQIINVVYSADNNQLSGSVPTSLFPSPISGSTVSVSFAHNQLSGSLPSQCSTAYSLTIDMSSNQFNGSIPSAWNTCNMASIKLNNNPSLSGSIPDALLSSGVTFFNASKTLLSGTLPTASAALKGLYLTETSIEFCSSLSTGSMAQFAASSVCDFSETSACDCQSSFMNCTSLCPCPLASRPSGAVQCVNGVWSTATKLIIPSVSGSVSGSISVVVITGNLTATSVEFAGLSTTLNITGCANDLTDVLVTLSDDEARSIGNEKVLRTLATIASYDSDGIECASLNNVAVSTRVVDSCRSVSTQKSNSEDGRSLSAYFTVDAFSCKLWWIIVASAVGGVVLISVVVIVVCVTCCSCCKKKVRPYAGSDSYLA